MTCEEFRIWFQRALAGDLPEDWPAEEYRTHLVECPHCEMVLESDRYLEAVTEYSSRLGPGEVLPSEVELEIDAVYGRIRRRRRVARSLVGAAVATVVLLAGAWVATLDQDRPGGKSVEPVTMRERANRRAREFAARFANDSLVSHTHGFLGPNLQNLTLSFTQVDPGADTYAFARSVVLSGWEQEFPKANRLDLVILDVEYVRGRKTLLRLQVDADRIPALAALGTGTDFETFCSYSVVADQVGNSLRMREVREGRKR